MTAAIVGGLLAGYGIAMPVGAIAPLIVSLSARRSLRVGAAAGLGAAFADGVYAVAAVLGGITLSAWIAPVARPLRWVAISILLSIALWTAYTSVRSYRYPAAARIATGLDTPPRAFAALLGLTLLNPMTIVYFAAIVLGMQDYSGARAFAWCTAVFAASASWQLTLAGGGAMLGRVLHTPRGRLALGLISAAMITALVLLLIHAP